MKTQCKLLCKSKFPLRQVLVHSNKLFQSSWNSQGLSNIPIAANCVNDYAIVNNDPEWGQFCSTMLLHKHNLLWQQNNKTSTLYTSSLCNGFLLLVLCFRLIAPGLPFGLRLLVHAIVGLKHIRKRFWAYWICLRGLINNSTGETGGTRGGWPATWLISPHE